MELASDLPEALASRAVSRLADWDWVGAKTDIDLALEFDPANSDAIYAKAQYLVWMGRLPEAIALRRQEIKREPLSSGAWSSLGVNYWFAGQLGEAEQAFNRALEIDPSSLLSTNRALLLLDAGRPAEALGICESLACSAEIHLALGNERQAQADLDAMLARGQGPWKYLIARVYVARGEVDRAFEWLDRAVTAHVVILHTLKVDPSLRPLHSDPRWAELLKKMNLPVD